MAAEYLWTFTKRGKFASADDWWAAWGRFLDAFEYRYGRKLRFVAVPELHLDAETWHGHVALCEWLEVVTMRRLWQRALGGTGREVGPDSLGNVDAKAFRRSPRKGRPVRRGARALAGYISKYIGKDLSASAVNRRSFSSSHGLDELCSVTRSHVSVELNADELCEVMAGALGRPLDSLSWFAQRFPAKGFEILVLDD
jgi:hypothetical protein